MRTRSALVWVSMLAVATMLPLRESSAQSWSELAPLNEVRQEVAVAALDGKVYVIGGIGTDLLATDSVEVYDPETDQWTFVAPLPTTVHHTAAVALGGKLYVMGGFKDFFVTLLDALIEYDPATNVWTQLASMPSARSGHTAAVVDGKIYVAGGDSGERRNDFAVYDPETDSWVVLPDLPTGRGHLGSVGIGGKFYAVGGRVGPGTSGILSTLEAYDPATGVWTTRASMPTARGGISAAAVGGYLLVFGGEGNLDDPNGIFDESEAYEPTADAWLSLTPMPTPRHGTGAAEVGDRVHIPGGADVMLFSPTPIHEVFEPGAELMFCDDGLDNDGDGLIDFPDDPGCDSALDGSERDQPLIDLDLSVVGTCPGTATLNVSGATPNGQVGVGWSANQGSITLPSDPCAGTTIDLANPKLLTVLAADGNGNASIINANVPANACGVFLQALDLTACLVSNVAQVP